MRYSLNSATRASIVLCAGLFLAACSGGSNNNNAAAPVDPVDPPAPPVEPPVEPPAPAADAVFEVVLTNLTAAQPLSPVAAVLHEAGFNSFTDGETASVALELMAEGGDNTDVLGEAVAAAQHLSSASSEGPVPPLSIGDAIELRLPSDQLDNLRFTVVTMLVHTNDAFTGINAANISNMAVGDTRTFSTPTWDAGTEANDELGANIPGPAFGGEGFNVARDDLIDRVRFHQGVVTSASVESGDPASDLLEIHRFDNPTARVRISRVE